MARVMAPSPTPSERDELYTRDGHRPIKERPVGDGEIMAMSGRIKFFNLVGKARHPMKDPTPSEIMLEAVRGFHARARQVLAKSKPDKAAAKRLMQEAQRLGRKIVPYLPPDAVLRQRIVADEPMSEEELRGSAALR